MTKYSRLILMGFFSLSIASCATKPASSTPELSDITNVKTNQNALIVVDTKGLRCDTLRLELSEKGNGIIGNHFIKRTWSRDHEPAIISVSPGAYKFSGGVCKNSQFVDISLSNLEHWFDYVEVSAGEVAVFGQLDVGAAIGYEKRGLARQAITSVLSIGGDTSKHIERQYPVYAYQNSGRLTAHIKSNYSELKDRLVIKRHKSHITIKEFEEVVTDAFAKREDGSYPNGEEARETINAYMASLPKS